MQKLVIQIYNHRYFKAILLFSVLIFLFIFSKIYVWFNTQSTDNAYVDSDISNISSEVFGVIEKIYVTENRIVSKNQIIAKIDDKDYKANLIKINASLKAIEYDIEGIEKNISLGKIEKERTKQVYDFAQANFKNANSEYNRIKRLNQDNYASKKNLGNAFVAFEKAKNDLSQAYLNMQKSSENLDLLEINRLSTIAKSASLKQEQTLASQQLENTEIRSPIDGIIGNSSMQEGNYVQKGVVLFSVVPINNLYIKANFKETQIRDLQPGMKAAIVLDAYPSENITGTIRTISPATGSKFSLLPPSNATGNFTKIVQRIPVTIDFDIPENLKNKIVPGMSSTVKIRID